ncbi:sodium:solute symporter family protein [Rhodococcoides fascians]|uniref:sodium:solute symporter family protein n=1 Tax=Rhodococcoides fascians TaxID=1828 RepID=UPI00050CC014|nr:sodium:solute symporter family protein [Rhodococcus fascians]
MNAQPLSIAVFIALFLFITAMGFGATKWRSKGKINNLDEWALGGRTFGPFITWFLLGGEIYTAYTIIALPAAVFSVGAFGFYAMPYAAIAYILGFLFLPKLVTLSRQNGYVTLTDFVNDRFKSKWLGLAVTVTGLLAILPYLALQLIGLEVVFGSLGIGGSSSSWLVNHMPLFVAFGILAAYTYSAGLRAPALIAFVKDILTYLVLIAAVIFIPIKLGGFETIFDRAADATAAKGAAESLSTIDPGVYLTVAFGSGLALFLYPHAITGLFAAKGAKTVRRNMSMLPINAVFMGIAALLGVMALAAGIVPKDGNPQYAVPQLLIESFPSWFVGIAFAAIAMCALVPAAIMAIAAGNLVSRNLYREFARRPVTSASETLVSKIVSVLIKVGALVFVLTLDPKIAVNFQLLAGIWILQILPTILIGLFVPRFVVPRALLSGLVVSIVYGTWAVYEIKTPTGAPFGGSTATPFFLSSPVYVAVSALVVNLVVAAVISLITWAVRANTRRGRGNEGDTPVDSALSTSQSESPSGAIATPKI